MKLICRNILLLFLLTGFSGVDVLANSTLPLLKTEFTKTIKKNYKMSADGDVTLHNKYGEINLKTWDRNEVNIAVTITVKSRSESTANDIFDRIGVDFSNGSSYVKAETKIESQKSSWWGNGDKGDFRIDYEVSMPKAASLELSNKYGDSEVDAIGGDASIDIKYGNFNIHSVRGDTKVNLGYGNGAIGNVKNAVLNVKYSKIKLKEAQQVNLESKYSKIYVDKANKIKSNSRYDTYDLGELKELSNDGKYDHFEIRKIDRITVFSKYTDFEVEELYGFGEFELTYGGVKIESLKRGFHSVSLDCDYTDCKVYVDDDVNFELDAITEYASIYYPSDLEVSFEKNKNSTHEVKGRRGNSGEKITARLSYGGLKLK